MSRIVHLNGEYLPEDQAKVSVFDRGFVMADAVYEVTSVLDGKLIDFPGHMARLARSLGELGIQNPHSDDEWLAIHREMVARNEITHGMVYLQVTRGTAPRDHGFPVDIAPSVVVTAKSIDPARNQRLAKNGAAGVTQPDIRWGRCDIKTVGLLPNVLAKQAAREKGAYECLMFDEMGLVTEGSSTNAWIVDEHGRLCGAINLQDFYQAGII